MRQPDLRQLAARVTERQPVVLEADRRRATIAAREAAPLADFQAGLVLGQLVICGNCSSFAVGADPATLGHCRRYSTESWPFVPFACAGFTASPKPAAPAFVPDPDGRRALTCELPGHPLTRTRRAS